MSRYNKILICNKFIEDKEMTDPFENRTSLMMCEDVDPFLQLKQLMEKSSFMNVTDPQFKGY